MSLQPAQPPADAPRVACTSARQTCGGVWNEKPLAAFPGPYQNWCEDCAALVDGHPAEHTDTVLRGAPGGTAALHLPREVTE